MMKTLFLSTMAVITVSGIAMAAPVDSIESSRATTSRQRIDAYLAQQTVADQLHSLGVTREQIDTRLAKLTDAQIDAMAAQIDLVQAGGMIQRGHPRPLGVLHCILDPAGRLFYNLYQLIFCWGTLK